MSGAAAAGVISATLGGLIYVVVFWRALRRARSTYSRALVRQLKATGQPVALRVFERRGTWNPAKGEPAGRLFANGQAVYSLDESGIVHLTFYPGVGGEQHYEGPIPPWHDSPEGRRRQTIVRRVWIVYALWVLVGFVAGFLIGHGSGGTRVLVGIGGTLGAMIVAAVATTVIRVVVAVRSAVRQQSGSSK